MSGDAIHVGERGLEPTLWMALNMALGVEAGERLTDRGTGHLEHRREPLLAEAVAERELADEQPTLQRPVRRLASRWWHLDDRRPTSDGCIQRCTRGCIHVLATYERAVAVASPSCERNENDSSPSTALMRERW